MAPKESHIISLILFVFVINGDTFIQNELDRIDKYELLYINTIDTNKSMNILQFTAFDQLYNIQLIENPHIIPSNIKHSDGNPSIQHDLDQYFTHLNKSCHYFGKVLNTEQSSNVALSICDKRGIRGRITAFGDTLIIKPSKYYLDIEYDRSNYHHITDQHLVYKLSDYRFPISFPRDTVKIPSFLQRTVTNDNTQRRRLNTVTNNVEVFILSDPILTTYYVTKYPTNWYDQLVSYFADQIHSVSAEYENTEWGSTVGTISVSLVELEVMYDYNGKYKALTPVAYDAECIDIQQSDSDCTIDGNTYLEDFTDYLGNFKNVSTFDTAQLWSKMGFEGRDGLAWQSTICQGAGSSSIVSDRQVGDIGAVTVSAHELGHIFGMTDDAGEDCDIYEGIMGKRPNGFSTCSIEAVQNYFDTYRRRVTCLLDGVRSFVSNYGESGVLPTSAPITKATSDGSSTNWQCVTVQNMDNTAFDGDWIWDGSTGTYKTYTLEAGGYYLYYITGVTDYWVISGVKGSEAWDEDILAYCAQELLVDCPGSWVEYVTDDGWYRDTTAYVSECDSVINLPTPQPTQITDEPTAAPEMDTDCVKAENMDMHIDFTGYWSMIGTYNANAMYRLNDYYLYFGSDNEWVISEVEGSESIDDILAYCRTTSNDTDVTDCEGPWRILNNQEGTYNQELDGIFTDCDDWICVGLLHMDKSVLDGYWTTYGVNDGRLAYTLNAVYLYYIAEWTQWVISRAFGSTDINTIWAYCTYSDIQSCANQWFIWDGDFAQDTASTVYDCGEEGDTEACSYYDCVSMAKLMMDGDNNNYNGEWYPAGCHNEEAYYTLADYGDTRYMCYKTENANDIGASYPVPQTSQWVIADELCDGTIYAYCEEDDILDCTDAWYMDIGREYQKDTTVLTWQCSAKPPIDTDTNNPDTDTDQYPCYKDWYYDDVLCIFSNGTLWIGDRVFTMLEQTCANDQPVFHYEVWEIAEVSKGAESYYLHYNNDLYADGAWIISVNDMSSNAEALCEESDLLECVKGAWVKQVSASDVFAFDEAEEMKIYQGWCDSGETSEDDDDDDNEGKTKKEKKGVSTVAVAVIIMSCILVVIIVMAIVVNRRTKAPTLKKGKSHQWQDSKGDAIRIGMSVHHTKFNKQPVPDDSDEDEQNLDVSETRKFE